MMRAVPWAVSTIGKAQIPLTGNVPLIGKTVCCGGDALAALGRRPVASAASAEAPIRWRLRPLAGPRGRELVARGLASGMVLRWVLVTWLIRFGLLIAISLSPAFQLGAASLPWRLSPDLRAAASQKAHIPLRELTSVRRRP